ncbi:unnamed protein product [Musa textilis]
MTADAGEYSVRSGVELEGTVGLGLEIEGDRKEGGDPNGIACWVGEEKDGGRVGRSVVVENGSFDNSPRRDLDLDGKVDPEAIGEQETSEGNEENGELIVENGDGYHEGVDYVIELATAGASVSKDTTTFDDVKEVNVEADSKGTVAEEGHAESGADEPKDKINIDMLGEKESDAKDGMCEEEVEMSKEEVNVELSSENNQDHLVDNTKLENFRDKSEAELDLTTIEDGEKQGGKTTVEEMNLEVESDSTVEVEKKPENAVAAVNGHVSSGSSVDDDKKQEPEIVGIGTDQQEVPKLATVECNDQEAKIMVNNIYHQLGQKVVDRMDRKLEIVAATTFDDDETDKIAPTLAVVTKEPLSMPSTPNNHDQAESVISESQFMPTEYQVESELTTEVEPEEELKTGVTNFVDQAEPTPAAEVAKEQKSKTSITEILPSESSVEQKEMKLLNGSNNLLTDKCLDKNRTVLDVNKRTTLQTVDDSESSESQKAKYISDSDAKLNKAEAGSEPIKNCDTIVVEHSNDLHPTEGSSSLDVPHVVDKEVEVPISMEALLDASDQPIGSYTQPCVEASPSEMEGGNFSAVDAPSPLDTNSGMPVESSHLANAVESMPDFANTCADIQDKLCNDVAGSDSHEAETGFNVAIDHVDKVKSDISLISSPDDGPCMNVNGNEEAVQGEAGVIEGIQVSTKDPSASNLGGEKADTPLGKPQAIYIIRVPRYVDDQLSSKIQIAQSEVNEKTQRRDSIKVAIEKQKVTCNEFWKSFETAKAEERAARAAVTAKRQQIDSVQLMMNKLKNAHSIEELHDKIRTMEFELQHATMPLKEEKQYIRELKQLRHQVDQLTSSMGSEAEIDEAFDQKEVDERFKSLKKELEPLRAEVLRTEANSAATRKKYDEQQQLLKGLQQQFKDADAVRQKAYGHWRELKNVLIEKNKHFGMYKNDQKSAENYISSKEFGGLQLHCSKQVEKVMNLWNNDDEFRMQYVKSNMNSTLRRLKTSDGRSLGPDEEPPVLRSNQGKGPSFPLPPANISNSVPPVALETKIESSKEVDLFPTLQAKTKNQPVKPKKTAKPISDKTKETVVAKVLDREVENNEVDSRTKEEEERIKKAGELLKKEEELRKQKSEAELKEQCRLEQRAKAKEAEERKKRQAEKAQARAEYRAQKEAELREKRRSKKHKKKGVTGEDTTVSGAEEDPAPSTETSPPEAARGADVTATIAPKRPSRPVVTAKQHNKIQSIPLPLRKKGKRKMATWMWVLLTVMVVLLLFLAGNYISIPSLTFPQSAF